MRHASASKFDGSPDPAGNSNMAILNNYAVIQTKTVIEAPAYIYSVFF
jgi:hypothetical protein